MAIQTAGQKTAKITKVRIENQATFPLPKEKRVGLREFFPSAFIGSTADPTL